MGAVLLSTCLDLPVLLDVGSLLLTQAKPSVDLQI